MRDDRFMFACIEVVFPNELLTFDTHIQIHSIKTSFIKFLDLLMMLITGIRDCAIFSHVLCRSNRFRLHFVVVEGK